MTASEADEWATLIARHPMFEAMGGEDIVYLLSDEVSQKHVVGKGETILKQDSVGNSLFVICEGAVSVMLKGANGESIELHRAGEGEVLGEMALFGQRLRAATLVTAEPCKLLEIAGDEFRTLMRKHSDMALYLLAKLSQRLRHTDDLILSRRIKGLDGSLGELGTRLDVIAQTTDAKLTAAQALFDQTNKRTAELIQSAESRQKFVKWIGGAALLVVSAAGIGTTWNVADAVKDTKEQLKSVVSDAKENLTTQLGRIETYAETIDVQAVEVEENATKAANSANSATTAAGTAEQQAALATENADKSGKATAEILRNKTEIDELKLGLDAAEIQANEVLADINFNLLKSSVGYETSTGSISDETEKYYIFSIKAGIPEFRSKFVRFIQYDLTVRDKVNRDGYIRIFKGALDNEEINFREDVVPELATHYLLIVAQVMNDNKRAVIAQELKLNALLAETSAENYLEKIFGEDHEPEFAAEIMLANYDEPPQWKRDVLVRVLAALRGK